MTAARLLGEEDAYDVATRFRAAHPWRLRLLSRNLAWGDLADDDNVRRFVMGHPFVAFRP